MPNPECPIVLVRAVGTGRQRYNYGARRGVGELPRILPRDCKVLEAASDCPAVNCVVKSAGAVVFVASGLALRRGRRRGRIALLISLIRYLAKRMFEAQVEKDTLLSRARADADGHCDARNDLQTVFEVIGPTNSGI